jgi:hypothetical protein
MTTIEGIALHASLGDEVQARPLNAKKVARRKREKYGMEDWVEWYVSQHDVECELQGIN